MYIFIILLASRFVLSWQINRVNQKCAPNCALLVAAAVRPIFVNIALATCENNLICLLLLPLAKLLTINSPHKLLPQRC